MMVEKRIEEAAPLNTQGDKTDDSNHDAIEGYTIAKKRVR